MSDQDDFEAIINNQPELPGGEDGERLTHIWAAIEHLWPSFYDGSMLIKGVLIAEYVDPDDGGRVLRFISSPECAPWDTLGLIESARQDARDLSRNSTMMFDDEDDDD